MKRFQALGAGLQVAFGLAIIALIVTTLVWEMGWGRIFLFAIIVGFGGWLLKD